MLKDPDNFEWEDLAFGYYNNGITVRTARYRLTRYFRKEIPDIELYDVKNDPFENTNIANDFPEIVNRLLPLWKDGDTGLYEEKND